MSAPQHIRVAHLLDGRHFGGAEQMVRRLMRAAPDSGVEAWAYCLSEGRLSRFLREEGLRVRVIASRGRFDPWVLGPIAAWAIEDGIQVLQAHTSRTHLLARLASRRTGIPNITTIHSPIAQDENRRVTRHPWRARVERWGRCWTDQIVSVSREEHERLIREEGVDPARSRWIPNGVEPPARPGHWTERREGRGAVGHLLEEAGLPPDTFVVAMIAQMRPRKGPEVLLEAFAQWHKKGGSGFLLMIGDDEFTGDHPYLNQLSAMANELCIEHNIRFTGFMDDPWRLAKDADLIALPSRFGEGLPLVLIEAMSHGLPLAASAIAGNRELAGEGERGWLHPAGDATILAEHLAEAQQSPEVRLRRGRLARSYYEDTMTLQRVALEYRELYLTLIPQTGASA